VLRSLSNKPPLEDSTVRLRRKTKKQYRRGSFASQTPNEIVMMSWALAHLMHGYVVII
jgi:hypothetical protein